jgi:hypothetical protein
MQGRNVANALRDGGVCRRSHCDHPHVVACPFYEEGAGEGVTATLHAQQDEAVSLRPVVTNLRQLTYAMRSLRRIRLKVIGSSADRAQGNTRQTCWRLAPLPHRLPCHHPSWPAFGVFPCAREHFPLESVLLEASVLSPASKLPIAMRRMTFSSILPLLLRLWKAFTIPLDAETTSGCGTQMGPEYAKLLCGNGG